MKMKITVEKLFYFVIMLFGLLALWGTRNLKALDQYTLGPAMLPRVYATAMIIFAALAIVTSKDTRAIQLKKFVSPDAVRGILALVLLGLTNIAIMYFGIWWPIFAFSFLCFWLVEKWQPIKAALMGLIWTGFLWLMFIKLLNINFRVY